MLTRFYSASELGQFVAWSSCVELLGKDRFTMAISETVACLVFTIFVTVSS